MSRLPRRWIFLASGLALIIIFAFRGPLGLTGGAKVDDSARAVPVTAATAEMRDVPVYAQAIGTVIANATVQVRSRIDGQIVAAKFREGQLVREGDLLFEIDRAPYEAALRAAVANLQRDEAQLGNAQRDLARANELSKKGYTSAQTRDAASAEMKALTASVAAGQAAVDQAQLQLDYTEIRSPIDGKTGPILVDAGNLIQANNANALVTVTQIQPVKISFSLAQQNLPRLQDQMAKGDLIASLRLHDDHSNAEDNPTASIDFIGNTVNTASGTIELRATYDNPDLRFVPGEFVDVQVRLGELKAAITVPHDAVNTGQQGLYVYVIGADDKVEMRDVTLLHQNGEIAAIKGAVEAGERVVTDGQLRLLPGSQVKIVNAEEGPAAS
jgi:multidrug efflux system membrane fusion protein